MKTMKTSRRRRREGSLLIVVSMASLLVVDASLEAWPSYERAAARSLAQEREYRTWRMNEGIRRFEAATGRLPASLEELAAPQGAGQVPFVPRIYEDPGTLRAPEAVRSPGAGLVSAVRYDRL